MDALRKAELEKKKAAERLEETIEQAQDPDGDDTVEIPQTDAEGDSSSEHQITRLNRTQVRSKEEIFAATAQLSLEPIEEVIRHRQGDAEKLDAAAQALADDLTDTGSGEPAAGNQDVDVGETMAFPKIELTEETQDLEVRQEAGNHGLPDESFNDEVVEGAKPDVPGIYDETIQGEAFRPESEKSYDETLPGVSAVELAKDLGEENQPTPVAAQTVFTAAATAQTSFRYKWPLIISLIVIVVIAGSVIIYQSVTPLVNQIPARQLTGDLRLRPPVQVTTTAAPPTHVTPPTTPPAQVKPAATPPVHATATATPPAQATPAATPSTPETTPKIVAATPEPTAKPGTAVPEKTAPAAGGSQVQPKPPALPPANTAVAGSKEPTLLPGEPEPALMRISQSKHIDKRGQVLNEAYAAFQSGDMDKARKLYEKVGKSFPDNRDVLLGLGAIAMKEGDINKVYEIYSRLYKLNPRDPIARAVLVNLDSNTDPVRRESTLKLMLNDHPNDAFLNFSLGNLYAAQSRWSEAQQAFFNAYRNDSVNPEYALNLAISLDHLGQSKVALNYYTTALKLADGQKTGFDKAAVRTRIKTLTAIPK